MDTYPTGMTKIVFDEVMKGKEQMFPDALLVERLSQEKKIHLIEFDDLLTKKMMAHFNMGKGEASTIAAAIKKKSIIATDNLQGRKAAKINNLSLVGSPEIIIKLFQKNKIDKIKAKEALQILKEEGWFNLYLLEKAEEDLQ